MFPNAMEANEWASKQLRPGVTKRMDELQMKLLVIRGADGKIVYLKLFAAVPDEELAKLMKQAAEMEEGIMEWPAETEQENGGGYTPKAPIPGWPEQH